MTKTLGESFAQRTEVWHGRQEIISRGLEELSKVRVRYDSILDANGPSIIINNEFVTKSYAAIKARGCRLRLITEISEANLLYSKELAKYVELRHLDGIKGNFGIVDGTSYGAVASSEERQFPTEYIYSTVKSFVEQQQYFFDMLWNRSVPAEQKIKEIEEGIEPQVIETVTDPIDIQKLAYHILKLSKKEILILFSTARVLYRLEKAGTINSVIQTAMQKPDLKIKILTPIIDAINKKALKKLSAVKEQRHNRHRIDIRQIESSMQTRVTVLIVDRKYLLTVEEKNDDKDDFSEAVGIATYSNSKVTVQSYASIFESLWMQTDLYQQIKEVNRDLHAHDRMQKEFINIAAHELRNPIQPILSLTEIIRNTEEDETNKELLDVVVRNAKKLRQLTEDVLDVTRIESKSLKLNKEQFDLEALAMHVIHDYKFSTGDKRILIYDYNRDFKKEPSNSGTKIVIVNADKHRIQQVLSNLIGNAVKFTKEGDVISIKMKIDDSRHSTSTNIIISIKDNGIGIDPEIMPRLFSKFASSNNGNGMGLGLFISKSIIEAHGGRIWAENNKHGKKGAVFHFSLPLT